MSDTYYQLNIQVRIQPVTKDGQYMNGGLEIREEQQITAQTFLEVAGILGQFLDLAEKLKAAR